MVNASVPRLREGPSGAASASARSTLARSVLGSPAASTAMSSAHSCAPFLSARARLCRSACAGALRRAAGLCMCSRPGVGYELCTQQASLQRQCGSRGGSRRVECLPSYARSAGAAMQYGHCPAAAHLPATGGTAHACAQRPGARCLPGQRRLDQRVCSVGAGGSAGRGRRADHRGSDERGQRRFCKGQRSAHRGSCMTCALCKVSRCVHAFQATLKGRQREAQQLVSARWTCCIDEQQDMCK